MPNLVFRLLLRGRTAGHHGQMTFGHEPLERQLLCRRCTRRQSRTVIVLGNHLPQLVFGFELDQFRLGANLPGVLLDGEGAPGRVFLENAVLSVLHFPPRPGQVHAAAGSPAA